MQEIAVTLADLGNGGAEERFQRELEKVLANIADVNTKRDAKRSITVKVEFVASDDRQQIAMKVNVSSSLATDEPFAAFALLRKGKGGELFAVETRNDDGDPEDEPRQPRLIRNQ